MGPSEVHLYLEILLGQTLMPITVWVEAPLSVRSGVLVPRYGRSGPCGGNKDQPHHWFQKFPR